MIDALYLYLAAGVLSLPALAAWIAIEARHTAKRRQRRGGGLAPVLRPYSSTRGARMRRVRIDQLPSSRWWLPGD